MPSVKNTEAESAEYRVVGPPGCGKTTWLGDQVQQAVESGMSVLISSLTKAAATEIGGRNLPISFDALGTLHSHCYHALGRPEKPSPRPAALAVVSVTATVRGSIWFFPFSMVMRPVPSAQNSNSCRLTEAG